MINSKKDYVSNYLAIKDFEFYSNDECSFATCKMREYSKTKDRAMFYMRDLLPDAKIVCK